MDNLPAMEEKLYLHPKLVEGPSPSRLRENKAVGWNDGN